MGEKNFLEENVERQEWPTRREEECAKSPCTRAPLFLAVFFDAFLIFYQKSVFHPKGRFLMQRLISASLICKKTPFHVYWPLCGLCPNNHLGLAVSYPYSAQGGHSVRATQDADASFGAPRNCFLVQ